MSDQDATQGADGATNGVESAPAPAETVTHDAAPSSTEPLAAGGAPEGELIASGEVTLSAENAVAAAGPLLARIEQLARAAFDAGQTEEHNLMAWLHLHLSAVQRAFVGAPQLPLSDDAKALIAEIDGQL